MRASVRSLVAVPLQALLVLVLPALAASAEPPQARAASPEAYTSLVEHADHLVLTNTSDRPIVAWMVQTRTRSSQGYEATSGSGTDAFRSGLFPAGLEGVLEPGESVEVDKPKPWLREDHRGPGASVRHYVGAIVFENNEALGEPEVVERIFERRRDLALQAALALDAVDTVPEKLRDLPSYARVFSEITDREEALAEIRRRAREDYRVAVDHLRPMDREVLTRERQGRGNP
jgi:hypothetical protein